MPFHLRRRIVVDGIYVGGQAFSWVSEACYYTADGGKLAERWGV